MKTPNIHFVFAQNQDISFILQITANLRTCIYALPNWLIIHRCIQANTRYDGLESSQALRIEAVQL